MTKEALLEAIKNKQDITNQDLSDKLDLSGMDLRHINFQGSDLSDVDLRDSDLRDANLSETNLYGADLRGAKLNRTNLHNSNRINCKIKRYALKGAYITGPTAYQD